MKKKETKSIYKKRGVKVIRVDLDLNKIKNFGGIFNEEDYNELKSKDRYFKQYEFIYYIEEIVYWDLMCKFNFLEDEKLILPEIQKINIKLLFSNKIKYDHLLFCYFEILSVITFSMYDFRFKFDQEVKKELYLLDLEVKKQYVFYVYEYFIRFVLSRVKKRGLDFNCSIVNNSLLRIYFFELGSIFVFGFTNIQDNAKMFLFLKYNRLENKDAKEIFRIMFSCFKVDLKIL